MIDDANIAITKLIKLKRINIKGQRYSQYSVAEGVIWYNQTHGGDAPVL